MKDRAFYHYSRALTHWMSDQEYGIYASCDWSTQKPHGFWISNDDETGWEQFVRSTEDPKWIEELKWRRQVKIDPTSILWIKGIAGLKECLSHEGIDFQWYRDIPTPFPRIQPQGEPLHIGEVDSPLWKVWWDKAKSKYQGVFVREYASEYRWREPTWYSLWDCDGGCIWDLTAITWLGPWERVETSDN